MNRKAIAWATFDWANSAFPTVVSTFVIAAYFSQAIAPDPATGQAQWGWMQTIAAVCIAVLSPILGALADNGGRRRAMLAGCTLVTAVFTALVWFAKPDPSWTLYVLVCVCLAVALVLLVQPNPSWFGLDRAASEHVRATALLVGA